MLPEVRSSHRGRRLLDAQDLGSLLKSLSVVPDVNKVVRIAANPRPKLLEGNTKPPQVGSLDGRAQLAHIHTIRDLSHTL